MLAHLLALFLLAQCLLAQLEEAHVVVVAVLLLFVTLAGVAAVVLCDVVSPKAMPQAKVAAKPIIGTIFLSMSKILQLKFKSLTNLLSFVL